MMSTMWVTIFTAAILFTTAQCRTPSNKTYDVIVVGMGAAGATAASTLAKAGKQVLALEALDRIGGRVWTQDFGDGVVELGAEWMHGTSPNPIYKAAVDNNVTIKEQDLELTMRQSDGNACSEVLEGIIKKGFEFGFEDDITTTQPLGDYVTNRLKDFIQQTQPDMLKDTDLVNSVLDYLNLAIDNYEGSNNWNDVNANSGFKELEGHQHASWHTLGYKTYFDLILNTYKDGNGLPTLDILLKKQVAQIQWSEEPEEKVTVYCSDGSSYTADTVIVTASLGVLKERHATLFSPQLPQQKRAALEKIGFGLIGKIILSFPEPWWQGNTKIYGFLWRPEDQKKVKQDDMWTTKIMGATMPMGSSNTIVLWTSGDVTRMVETMPEHMVKRKSMEILRKFMGGSFKIPEPTGFIKTDWYTNSFFRGSYSFDSMDAASSPGARSALHLPLLDSSGKPKVLFAGEATHDTQFSTVHGAADSGIREANRLLPASSKINFS